MLTLIIMPNKENLQERGQGVRGRVLKIGKSIGVL
jgi:hypothetical protein